MHGNRVADAGTAVPDQLGRGRGSVAVDGLRVPLLGRVLRLLGCRQAEGVGPLLQGFLVCKSGLVYAIRKFATWAELTVGVAESVVGGAVPAISQFRSVPRGSLTFTEISRTERKYVHQHPRSRPSVTRVVRAHGIAPLGGRLGDLAVGALVVPARRVLRGGRALDEEAAVRYTAVGRGGLEDVRVRARQDLRHHGARAAAGHKGAVAVAAEVLDGVVNHVGDGLAVAAAVVSQGCVMV